ncbi:flagellar assembly protein FliH [Silvibacterium bohemicum]|uniref:Flagellar assembly protein FliH n=1 Tax=Silvibacterium bohemicum TaxID=1577686 RepID=A0A841K1E0_9BACT|nr:FliH/SctL family protein [Silvibacterium bohemicum]MBB6145001.1 flagellar assembly protein FliH [Silvibacterium bohemicum]
MSSSAEFGNLISLPVMTLEYRDISDAPSSESSQATLDAESKGPAEVELSEEEFATRINNERADAMRQTEQRLRQEYEAKLQAARGTIATAISAFETERTEYYSRVEAEVVQLALAIAKKILHREAQVDPMLVAALVRMAIEKMSEGSSVNIRVAAAQAAKWKQYFNAQASTAKVEIVEDVTLTDYDCILETELGSANFGLDTQLKEVEKGFFDLLALRPATR